MARSFLLKVMGKKNKIQQYFLLLGDFFFGKLGDLSKLQS